MNILKRKKKQPEIINLKCEKCDWVLKQTEITETEIMQFIENKQFEKINIVFFNSMNINFKARIINMMYDFYKCENCNWFKFVKRGELRKIKEE